ncbi:MAG: conjugal transfer protein [Firmicutes bacterium]|nr:conjugal transfer protein [Bacillota bacterium]
MDKSNWLLCPVYKNKTRIKLRQDTMLMNFPLFCPKCKKETLVNVQQLNMLVIGTMSIKNIS